MKLMSLVLLCALVELPATSQDSRAQIETEVMGVLDEWMAAFNRMDMAAWERTMHFPHYRLAGGTMRVRNCPGELRVENVKRVLGDDWHHSGWDHRKIIHLSDSTAHVGVGNYQKLPTETFRYTVGNKLVELDYPSEALALFQKATRDPKTPPREKAFSHLRAGELLDLTGRREEAIAQYEEVQRLQDFERSHKAASRYLKKPYRR